jgi:hypothetical protein
LVRNLPWSPAADHPHPLRSHRSLVSSAFALLAAFAAWAPARAAHAQAKTPDFSVERFDPAMGPRNYFTTRGVRTDGKMT